MINACGSTNRLQHVGASYLEKTMKYVMVEHSNSCSGVM